MDLTICVPCFGRPERTIRLVNQIATQSIGNWEAYIIGDCCDQFQIRAPESRRAHATTFCLGHRSTGRRNGRGNPSSASRFPGMADCPREARVYRPR